VRTTAEFVPLRRWESLFAHGSHRLILFFFFRCSEGKIIEVCGKYIKKTFQGQERYAKLQRLKGTYDLLKAKAVPNFHHLQMILMAQWSSSNRKEYV